MENTKDEQEKLESLKNDMEDDYESWQQAEKEIKDSIKWRDQRALKYAESAIKYYNLLNKLNN